MQTSTTKGFTLVELAIVLVIIALLVGGAGGLVGVCAGAGAGADRAVAHGGGTGDARAGADR